MQVTSCSCAGVKCEKPATRRCTREIKSAMPIAALHRARRRSESALVVLVCLGVDVHRLEVRGHDAVFVLDDGLDDGS